jgi:hypothetical protein
MPSVLARACLLVALVLPACNPTLTAGYDATSVVRGPLANVVSTRPDAGNYAFGIGGGARNFTIELGVEPRASAEAQPAPAFEPAPRYLTTMASLDMRWTLMRFHALSLNLHAGPAVGVLDERTSGAMQLGEGFRTGGGIVLALGHVNAFVDLYRSGLVFSDGPAAGTSILTGVTVGVGLR